MALAGLQPVPPDPTPGDRVLRVVTAAMASHWRNIAKVSVSHFHRILVTETQLRDGKIPRGKCHLFHQNKRISEFSEKALAMETFAVFWSAASYLSMAKLMCLTLAAGKTRAILLNVRVGLLAKSPALVDSQTFQEICPRNVCSLFCVCMQGTLSCAGFQMLREFFSSCAPAKFRKAKNGHVSSPHWNAQSRDELPIDSN